MFSHLLISIKGNCLCKAKIAICVYQGLLTTYVEMKCMYDKNSTKEGRGKGKHTFVDSYMLSSVVLLEHRLWSIKDINTILKNRIVNKGDKMQY